MENLGLGSQSCAGALRTGEGEMGRGQEMEVGKKKGRKWGDKGMERGRGKERREEVGEKEGGGRGITPKVSA